MEDKEKAYDLYIPANCSPLDYVIEGYTAKEITCIGLVGITAVILGVVVYWTMNSSLPAVFVGVVLVAAAAMFFRRDQFSENCIDKIKLVIRYRRSVQKYEYLYVNIYEKTEQEVAYAEEKTETK